MTTKLATFLMRLSDCCKVHNKVKRKQSDISSKFIEKIEGIVTIEECPSFDTKIKEEREERHNISINSNAEGLQISMERLL